MKPALHAIFLGRLRSYLASPPSPAASRALRAAARLAGLLHQLAGGFVVALALDALHLGQQLGYELAQTGIVGD